MSGVIRPDNLEPGTLKLQDNKAMRMIASWAFWRGFETVVQQNQKLGRMVAHRRSTMRASHLRASQPPLNDAVVQSSSFSCAVQDCVLIATTSGPWIRRLGKANADCTEVADCPSIAADAKYSWTGDFNTPIA